MEGARNILVLFSLDLSYLKNEIAFYFTAYCTRNPVPFFAEDSCNRKETRRRRNTIYYDVVKKKRQREVDAAAAAAAASS